jgi:hypothetical protein
MFAASVYGTDIFSARAWIFTGESGAAMISAQRLRLLEV